MSIAFSNTSSKNGLIQLIERNCNFEDGTISGNSTLLAQFTADINLAVQYILGRILSANGWSWQPDDTNHNDYPIATANIVSGQRDYAFTTDGNSNLILDVYRVAVADSSGNFRTLTPVDQQSGLDVAPFFDGQNTSGTPTRYDKTANGIFLDPIPNYNYTGGLKVFFNREASSFLTSDTTKKPGLATQFHEYFALRPSYQFACRKSLDNEKSLKEQMLVMERDILEYYGAREKDVVPRMTINQADSCR